MTTAKSPAESVRHHQFRLIKANGDYITFLQPLPRSHASSVPKTRMMSAFALCPVAMVGHYFRRFDYRPSQNGFTKMRSGHDDNQPDPDIDMHDDQWPPIVRVLIKVTAGIATWAVFIALIMICWRLISAISS
jgi:hypothetical protein